MKGLDSHATSSEKNHEVSEEENFHLGMFIKCRCRKKSFLLFIFNKYDNFFLSPRLCGV